MLGLLKLFICGVCVWLVWQLVGRQQESWQASYQVDVNNMGGTGLSVTVMRLDGRPHRHLSE